MKGLQGLAKPKKQAALEKAILKPGGSYSATADEEFEILAKRIGENNAKIVRKWRRRGLTGTSPEILVYDWLTRRKLEFQFQAPREGGRRLLGGMVIDFVVWLGVDPMAWRVQGVWWHTGSVAAARDKAQAVRILAMKIGGRRFIAVCDLGEMELYANHNRVCENALRGRSTPEV